MRRAAWFCAVVLLVQPLPASEPWFSGGGPPAASTYTLPLTVKVGLARVRGTIRIGCTHAFLYGSAVGGHAVHAQGTITLQAARHGFLLNGRKVKGVWIFYPEQDNGLMTVNGRRYRGRLIVNPAGGLRIIEELPLNQYLYGVLPREAEPRWALEALKAQAVVSRTFVVANLGSHASRGYDVSSDVFSQVYGGFEDETPSTNQAVDATVSQIVVDDQDRPIQAFFHSSCGGATEDPRNVWNLKSELPYLTVVKDPYCTGDPHYRWWMDISAKALEKKLQRAGYRIQGINKIRISETTASGRAKRFLVSGDRSYHIPGNRFRLILGPDNLRSTRVTEISFSHRMFYFVGRGWGHGVGFCQWGAQGRALEGQNYKRILETYYPHTHLAVAKT